MLRRLPPPPPRSRCLRMLDAISIGITRGLNIVLRWVGSTPEQPEPIRLFFLLYFLMMFAIAITFITYIYQH